MVSVLACRRPMCSSSWLARKWKESRFATSGVAFPGVQTTITATQGTTQPWHGRKTCSGLSATALSRDGFVKFQVRSWRTTQRTKHDSPPTTNYQPSERKILRLIFTTGLPFIPASISIDSNSNINSSNDGTRLRSQSHPHLL